MCFLVVRCVNVCELCGCMEICNNMLFSVIGGDLSIICWGKTLCETFLQALVVGM